MKTTSRSLTNQKLTTLSRGLILSLLPAWMLLAPLASAQTRFVTLQITDSVLTNQVSIATNEIAEIVSSDTFCCATDSDHTQYPGGSGFRTKDGITTPFALTPLPRLYSAGGGSPGESVQWQWIQTAPPHVLIVGPAVVGLYASSFGGGYCTVKIVKTEPASATPGQTLIIPQGGGATVSVESSADLVHWLPATLGVITNAPANMFFRIRADRL